MQALKEAREKPGKVVLLFEDEATFYRQPSQGWLWAWMGRKQPKMPYSHRANTRMRVVGFMDAVTGKVVSWEMPQVTVNRMAQCLRRVSAIFTEAETIYLVWDNWLVHEHPTVQKALEKDPRIRILPLPTYSPWLNAIEKLWRLLRQEVCHSHPWCDDFLTFRIKVMEKLNDFIGGSELLLQYCGLSY